MKTNRRDFLLTGAGAFALAALNGCCCGKCRKSCGPSSCFNGVAIGAITYSYRSMPIRPYAILDYAVESGIETLELMGNHLECDAGYVPSATPAKDDKAGQAKLREELRAWRLAQSPATFEKVRARYAAVGVKIHIVKFSDVGAASVSDAEMDYYFNAAKAMGASAITREVLSQDRKTLDTIGARIAAYADKHVFHVAFHNHMQINAKTYDGPLLGLSPNLRINYDIGHYVAANDDDAVEFVRKYFDRIESVHIKDRTKKAHGSKNLMWGKGDTPLARLFACMQEKKATFPADVELEYAIPSGSNAVKEVARCAQYSKSIIA